MIIGHFYGRISQKLKKVSQSFPDYENSKQNAANGSKIGLKLKPAA